MPAGTGFTINFIFKEPTCPIFMADRAAYPFVCVVFMVIISKNIYCGRLIDTFMSASTVVDCLPTPETLKLRGRWLIKSSLLPFSTVLAHIPTSNWCSPVGRCMVSRSVFQLSVLLTYFGCYFLHFGQLFKHFPPLITGLQHKR